MKLSITAKNMVVTPSITARIEKKTERMSRYLRPDTEMLIRMRKEKNDMRIGDHRAHGKQCDSAFRGNRRGQSLYGY